MALKKIKDMLDEEYCIEYDTKNKIVMIHKPIPVKHFMLVRMTISDTEYKEIRIDGK